ncbi:hypothetical protein H2198_007468 [Neophaeococcomyces mojaviensis]|uniref:Uncharacterized protein n=1 Tax=Neophaeococcomyces mojaviensis TaxID=3383035 RepID=A0ACC3A046_9EURO|nr:hypothetical protein H2198_007468 [Knufia sp. JES_112]
MIKFHLSVPHSRHPFELGKIVALMNSMYLANLASPPEQSLPPKTETARHPALTNLDGVQHLIRESQCTLTPAGLKRQELEIMLPYSRSWSAISKFFSQRRIFSTETGTYGIGPQVMRLRGHLCVLLGGQVPFALKAAKDDKFMLLGEVFIDRRDVMFGEAMESGQIGALRDLILV